MLYIKNIYYIFIINSLYPFDDSIPLTRHMIQQNINKIYYVHAVSTNTDKSTQHYNLIFARWLFPHYITAVVP